jgi:Flp pilus assembly protein TadB
MALSQPDRSINHFSLAESHETIYSYDAYFNRCCHDGAATAKVAMGFANSNSKVSPKTKSQKQSMSFEAELQFVFNLKSQLNAGINQLDALRFAVSRAPEFAFKNTRQALTSQTNVYSALHDDSKVYKVASLASCANLLELSSQSGSSINEALTQVADKLMTRRNQEQLIATELASTKATVFVLAGLPIMGAGMGLMLGSDSISWLLGSPAGRVCLSTWNWA